jgi:hypothetical protein
MRLFTSLHEAASEIQRDLFKSPKVISTRVQNRAGLSLTGREQFGYTYALDALVPETPQEIVRFGQEHNFPLYVQEPIAMKDWLSREMNARLDPGFDLGWAPADSRNPALRTTYEGLAPSYTYRERLVGMMESFIASLTVSLDTRRAFWPMFRPEDSMRAPLPTRVPCTLGYQPLVRDVGGIPTLMFFYLQRSCDFDNFWLSDVWFAKMIQRDLIRKLHWRHHEVAEGLLVHFIISFHSFFTEGTEVY